MEFNQKVSFIDKGDRSLKGKSVKGRVKDTIAYVLIGMATAFTVGILAFIIGFIFVKGASHISWDFIKNNYEAESTYVKVATVDPGNSNQLGLRLDTKTVEGKEVIVVSGIEGKSKADDAVNNSQKPYPLKKGDVLNKVGKTSLTGVSLEEANNVINQQKGDVILVRVSRPGGGIRPMLVTTLMMIGLSLLIACPIGIFAAIYLTEYAKPGRLVSLIRFATESLSGIPSIIYGLFGMLLFVIQLNLGYSILAGALTLSIILLPVIIRQTEESIKAVPPSYREASFGLGATKLQTIRKAVVPSAIPGIIVAIILSVGRIVGESAALLLTAGTVARIPDNVLTSGSTLTVKAYLIAKEEGDIGTACAIGIVIVAIILILNGISKWVSSRYAKGSL